jgi:Bacterial regulatory proteins, tetR family
MWAWSSGAAGVLISSYRVPGRGEECGFLDLPDRLLLGSGLGPSRAAAAAEDEWIGTEHDGDGGRSAPRAAWHENLPGRLLVDVGLHGDGWWLRRRRPVVKAASGRGTWTVADQRSLTDWTHSTVNTVQFQERRSDFPHQGGGACLSEPRSAEQGRNDRRPHSPASAWSPRHSVIAEDGVQALTMRSLAARLGVVPGALYHHVRNKEQLQDLGRGTKGTCTGRPE